jgi:PAS domain S-box-containing protein
VEGRQIARGKEKVMEKNLRGAARRRLADIKLRRSQDSFLKVFSASSDLISISLQGDGTLLDVNDSLLRVTGYERAEIIGRRLLDLKLWAPAHARPWLAAVEWGPVRNWEVTFSTRTGQERVGLMSADIITFNDRTSLLSVVRDITDNTMSII